nr:hypothetical protein CFP56_26295 [Quercus suber]
MTDAEDRRLWPEAVEKHFIDILLEEDAKGNMPQGQFKTGTWTIVMTEFNNRTNKNYNKTQLTQKYQRLKTRTAHSPSSSHVQEWDGTPFQTR